MFIGVRGWRCINTVMYIWEEKVEGSIHGCGKLIRVAFWGDRFKEKLSHGLANTSLWRVSNIILFRASIYRQYELQCMYIAKLMTIQVPACNTHAIVPR